MAVNLVSQEDEDATSCKTDSVRTKTITVMKVNLNSSLNMNANKGIEIPQTVGVSNSASLNDINEDPTASNTSTLSIKINEMSNLCKGEHLQQLSTNALPPYTPGSPPRITNLNLKSLDYHCCTDCGDTFALKSSLVFHLERRSVLIKFPCEACNAVRIFYNRCNLLSHIRSHEDHNVKFDISKAVVTVLPRVFMDGIQNEFVNNLDDELNSIDDNDALPPAEMLECSLQVLEESSVPSIEESNDSPNLTPNLFSIIKVKCWDCNEEFDSALERKDHLTNGDKIPMPAAPCDKCGLICPSKCSLKAHLRIHLQISPYVCPECGESPDPHWHKFLAHVNYQCFHNSRSIGFKCPVCKGIFSSNELLLQHMESHTEKYAKCSECPRAYNSTQAFKAHNNIYHDGQPLQYTMIFKCSLCDIVFVSNDQMLNHRSTHLKEQVSEYVFSCMECNKLFENKARLQEHLKLFHPKAFKQSIQIEASTKRAKSPVRYKGNVECLLCNSVFYSQQGYNVHISKAHLNVSQKCNICLKVMPNRKQMIQHGKLHLHEKKTLCLFCNNKKFSSSQELDSHLDSHVKKLKFSTFCPICDRLCPSSSLEEALNHLREEHYLPQKISDVAKIPGRPSLSTICHFCRDSFVSVTELQAHLKNKHDVESTSSKPEDILGAPLKKQRTGGNSCAKCDFQCETREEFKKHILTHKTNPSSFQCQECGLCFIVEPSLCKHLRIVHKISDAVKYIKEEGTNYVSEYESNSGASKRGELECSVCFASFSSEASLKTHMRSHGMAFIQANKSGLL